MAEIKARQIKTGTADGDMVELGVGGTLPAVDGSAITSMTKSQVGLSNADNTSDASKPVSTSTQTALDAKTDGNGFKNIYDYRIDGVAPSVLSGTLPGVSVVKNNTGEYTVSHSLTGGVDDFKTYINAEPAAPGHDGVIANVTDYTATSFKVYLHNDSGSAVDVVFNGVVFSTDA